MTSLAGIHTWNSFVTALVLSMASYISEVSFRYLYLEGQTEQKQDICSGKHLGCLVMHKSYVKTSLTTLTDGQKNCMKIGVPASPSLS